MEDDDGSEQSIICSSDQLCDKGSTLLIVSATKENDPLCMSNAKNGVNMKDDGFLKMDDLCDSGGRRNEEIPTGCMRFWTRLG